MTKRITATLLSACAATALIASGCSSSSTSGSGSTNSSGGQSSPGGGTSATQPASGGATPTTAPALASKMLSAMRSVTSAHIQMSINASGQTVTASGDERLAGGQVAAMDLNMAGAGLGQFQMIIVNKKTYMKLPQALTHSTKPWLLVSANSSNPMVANIGKSMSSTLDQTSVDYYRLFVQSAKSVADEGSDTVGGAPATHYRLVVDPKKLGTTQLGRDALKALGGASVPVDLWVDGTGRPVKVVENITAMGQHVRAVVTLSKYNQPVQVTAPPASQVSTG